MLAYLAIIIVYFYGVGHPPEVRAVQVESQEACAPVTALAKSNLLKRQDVRDVRVSCMAISAPPARDKV